MNDYIIAGGAIIFVIFLYIIVKQSQKKKNTKSPNIENKIEDIYKVIDPKKDKDAITQTKKEQTPPPPSQKETTKTQQPPQKEEVVIQKLNLKKREAPQYDKITKENLKEFAGLKILVAEDNIINQKVINGLLAESGIKLVFANDGLEAINLLNNQKDFDIVLMDANMPNMDGLEATRKIKQHDAFKAIPIIALSGDIASDDIKRMLNAGMDDHLEKPLKIDALYEILYQYTDPKQIQANSTQQESHPNTTILNIQKGIEICGAEDFYKEILQEFITNYQEAHKQLVSFLRNNDIKSADKLLLDLLGISANIGAEDLHKTATKLKLTLPKNPKPKAETEKFYKSFETLLKKIKEYL